MLSKMRNVCRTIQQDWELTLFSVCCLGISVAIRFALLPANAGDMPGLLKWYDYIVSNGRFLALKNSFSDYSPGYNFILTAVTFLPIGKIAAIKMISLPFDYLAAWVAFRIVRARYPHGPLALAATFLVLFSPTVLLNSAYWGQCDAIYSSCLLSALYYFGLRRPAVGMFWVGSALAFKLQASFISPLLLFLILRRELRIRELLIAPLPYLLASVPCLWAGRPWREVLDVYLTQIHEYTMLTADAPTLYNWLPAQPEIILGRAGVILAAFVALAFAFGAYRLFRRRGLRTDLTEVLQVGLGAYVLLVFFLPRMHERYFFAADLTSLIYLFYFPRLFLVPMLINLASVLSYGPFLFGMTAIPMHYVSLLPLSAAVLIVHEIIRGALSPAPGPPGAGRP
jgi:Gpi18-like mannosyltransferase